MTKPNEKELNEIVEIGGFYIKKEGLYIHTLALTTATLCSSLVKMIDEIKGVHQLWTTNLKNTLQKAEIEIHKRLDLMADSPEMLEKMTDAEIICSKDIQNIRSRIHSELYKFCVSSEEERLKMITEDNKRQALEKILFEKIKLATFEDLEFINISFKKRKK